MFEALVRRQAGIITAAQAIACGVPKERLRSRVRSGRWQRVFHGSRPAVYAVFDGPLPRESVCWAAVLLGGPDAILSHHTAAESDGLIDDPSPIVHVTIPWNRQVRSQSAPRVVFHRSRRIEMARHPARLPPRTRIEETVLDLAQGEEKIDAAMAWLATACQGRVSTPDRLLAALGARRKARWRGELREALGDVREGAHTLLEPRYLRDVEQAHGLPKGIRQTRVIRGGRTNYDDVRYEGYGTVVELDGATAHPPGARRRDLDRDNYTNEQGDTSLRYSWGHVTQGACVTALQVARVLAARGWTGTPHPCTRPHCALRANLAA